MDPDRVRLPLLQQREIEARIVGPLVRAFAEEIGRDRAVEIVAGVIRDLAREAGDDLAREVGERSLEAFAGTLHRWSEGGALEIDVIEQTPERLSFDVTRCRYAELYQALGLADLGASLSCQQRLFPGEGVQPGHPARPYPHDHGGHRGATFGSDRSGPIPRPPRTISLTSRRTNLRARMARRQRGTPDREVARRPEQPVPSLFLERVEDGDGLA